MQSKGLSRIFSELKLTKMGEINSDDYSTYYCGQESLRRNRGALIFNKRVQNAVLGCDFKNVRMMFVHCQGEPFNIRVIHVYGPITNAEEAEAEWFYDSIQEILKLTTKSVVFFIIRD